HVLLGEIVSRSNVDAANAPSHEEACNVTRDLKPFSTRLPRIVDRDFCPRGMRANMRLPALAQTMALLPSTLSTFPSHHKSQLTPPEQLSPNKHRTSMPRQSRQASSP
ncbi:unnamed protein product, partial [Ectocarpus sp. 12 AP-2014]